MKRYHGSNETLTEIRGEGIFGGLFAACRGAARGHGKFLHRVVSPRPLSDYELNYEIPNAWEVAVDVAGDEVAAEAILSPACPVPDDCAPEDFADVGWELQRLRGVLASRLGFTSVEMEDEHGTTWLCLPGCIVEFIEVTE